MDRFHDMWKRQHEFMQLLKEKRSFPDFPVDIESKSGQSFLKEISHECMHELFEAIHLLKNSKSHRATDVTGFDRASFVEEISDALHYFIEICIIAGVTPDELYEEFVRKGDVNTKRIKDGY